MAVKTVDVEVTWSGTFEYDPDSKEFREMAEGYRVDMYPNADEDDILAFVAAHVQCDGAHEWIEGVGYLKVGDKEPESPFSGITLLEEPRVISHDVTEL